MRKGGSFFHEGPNDFDGGFQPSRSGAAREKPNSDAADSRCDPDTFERDADGGEHDQQCARG